MVRTKREETEIVITLTLSWLMYGFCQGDFIVPGVAFAFVFPSYLKEIFGRQSERSMINMSWRSLISIAIVLGGLWRNFVPPPDVAISFVPIVVPALQTASIFVAILAWFQFDYKWRAYYLKSLPWLTVALSINVPFNALTQLVFWLFCFIAVGFMMIPLYFPTKEELPYDRKKGTEKNSWIYAYPIFLGVIASGLFVTVVQGIKLGDDVFMHLITDYVGRRNFSLFSSTLNLNGSGTNRIDLRPVLEVDATGGKPAYLVGQVFDEYEDGVWKAPTNSPRMPLLSQINSMSRPVELVMFEFLEDVVPVPRGLVSMASKGKPYQKDRNGIVYNQEKKIPRTTFVIDEEARDGVVDELLARRLTRLPVFLAEELGPRLDRIVGDTHDPWEITQRLEQYFRGNFQYSLYVNFRADNQGLLYMLDQRRPAYCSYFASAMTLMLRQRGIPARVVAGFLATEESQVNRGKYIVRGRDAHAWVEALLPVLDPRTNQPDRVKTGLAHWRWYRFDPTPSASRLASINAENKVNFLADWLWCSQKRMKAALLDVETKTLVMILFGIILLIILEEIFKKVVVPFLTRKRKARSSDAEMRDRTSNPYWPFYRRFDDFIKNQLRLDRPATETDAELITRLQSESGIPQNIVSATETFLQHYHAARFGMKRDEGLEATIENVVALKHRRKIP